MPQNFKALVICFLCLLSCKQEKNKDSETASTEAGQEENTPFFKLSLAQWSLHEPIESGELSPLDFARKASEMGFEGLEYVSQLYTDELEKYPAGKAGMDSLMRVLKEQSDTYNLRNVLIMVDHEGDLASAEEKERDAAVENHKKWVDAARYLGCHSIRVNLFGAGEKAEWKKASIDGLSKLSKYANTKNINILVENHGGLSSDAALLMEVMREVDMDNCGTLPDFGNFCLKREGGERWDAPCVEEYPRYQGIGELMPKAKAVSAKAYAFDEMGQETIMDYTKILKIVKDAGYTGFIGVEYEGVEAETSSTPEEGILKTKELLLRAAQELN